MPPGPTEVGFYHLTRTTPDAALPALLGRTLAAGQRALVRLGNEDRIAVLDELLWASKDPEWLPHGTARTGKAPLQPIWLTTGEDCPNGARYLFLLDGLSAAELASYDRVFDLFDGSDPAAVASARLRWAAAKASGLSLTYWQQGDRGWVRGATTSPSPSGRGPG
ncbi:MAG: DNA polymerase III subunit chi [Janthinobacterium lividum]